MLKKYLSLVAAIVVIIAAAGSIANAQANISGKYIYMYENTTDEGGVALILNENGVALWKNIEDGEERRYERKGSWKLSEDQKNLTINFLKDSARNDFQSDAFEIVFEVSATALSVKSSKLPGIKVGEAVFKKQ